MIVSDSDIKSRIEKILSDILSDKHEAKITITFSKDKEIDHGHNNSTRNIEKK